MELNRKQIISELKGLGKFITCPEYINDALRVIEELTEENEDLKAQCRYYAEAYHSVKADTVRKMQERIAEHATNGFPRKIRLDVVDKIAKEILEDK